VYLKMGSTADTLAMSITMFVLAVNVRVDTLIESKSRSMSLVFCCDIYYSFCMYYFRLFLVCGRYVDGIWTVCGCANLKGTCI